MHEIFDRQDVILAERVLNDRVIGQRDTLAVDFAVATLVDQLADGLQVWLSEAMGETKHETQYHSKYRTRM